MWRSIAFVYILSSLRCSFFSSSLRQRRRCSLLFCTLFCFPTKLRSAKGERELKLCRIITERDDDSAVGSRRFRPLPRVVRRKRLSGHWSLLHSRAIDQRTHPRDFPPWATNNASVSAKLREIIAMLRALLRFYEPPSGLQCRPQNG